MKSNSSIRFFIPILLLLLVLTTSCSNNKKPTVVKPDNLIEKQKLSKTLFDVYIIESVIYFKGQKGIDLGLYTTASYNYIFTKHGVTRKQFFQSLSYYLETDEKASSMFLDVINQLMSMQKTSISEPVNQPEGQNVIQSSENKGNDTIISDPLFRKSKKNR